MCETRIPSLWRGITIVIVICCCSLSVEAKYSGGSGTADDPYQIADANDLLELGTTTDDYDKHFILIADVNMVGYTFTTAVIAPDTSTDSWYQGTIFNGVFDGADYKIQNLTIDTAGSGNDYLGFFGMMGGRARNLGMENVSVIGGYDSDYLGGLCGVKLYGTISNCYSTGKVTGGDNSGDIGGLCGENYYVTMTDCYSECYVSCGKESHSLGGLVGSNYHSTISNCYSIKEVTGGDNSHGLGGLCGGNVDRCTIRNCYSTGKVTGGDNSGELGGLSGYNRASTISNCYSTGEVTGGDNSRDIGGLCGENFLYGTIRNCYSIGSVTGDENVGGLCGLNRYGGSISDCFWDIETSGTTTSDGGTCKTTYQMQLSTTFLAWGSCGNEGTWTIDEGKDYPRLLWEDMPGELITEPSYGGGSGTPNDPYLIYTAEQLNSIGLVWCHLDLHFKLMADIDLAAFTGTSFNIIRGFTGVFDGNGHTISNFGYTSTNTLKIGLFALVSGANAEVKNLGLIHAEVDGGNSNLVGSLVGHLAYGTITNCYVEGGSVAGARSVGGLVGYSYKGSITNCYSNGNVSGADDVGGLVGGNAYGSVSYCYSTGDVSGDSFVGGLVGRNAAIVSNCYSTSDVNGVDYVGGLVGHNGWIGLDIPGYIFNCYSTGWIRGDSNVGGLVGYNKLGDIDRSFWDIETSGHTDSDGGTGLPTAEMQTVETFFEWVCDHAWTIDEGKDYPRLWWENALGEPLSPFSGGSGTQAEPYLIYTAEQMNSIGLFPCFFDKHFKLMADIDLSRVTGTSYNIIGNKNYPFRGVFDGNNHTISNFNRVLFGYVSGEIKDLGLIDPNIYSGNCSLVGNFWHGTITNCYVEGGRISGGNYVGSLVGRNHYGSITNCYSTANISGDRYVGGLVGWNHSTITNCYSTSSVSGYHYVGGLVGYNNYGTITNCYSDGSVSGNTDIGGLIGTNLSRVAAFKSIPFNLRYVSGTCLSLDDDEVSSAIPIPFAFNFYGTDISQLYISSNGFVTFLPGQDDGCCSGQALPDPDSPNGLIAGFWADLSPYDGGDICYQSLGTSGSREFVVGFYDVPHCCEADNNPVTFEIILHEGTNDIELQYGSAPSEGETHSVGIENFDGTDGLQIAFGDVSLINKGFLITAEINIDGGISDSYSTATVTGNDDVGGLVGWNNSIIRNCYATGHVNGTNYVGGLVGYDSDGIYTKSFWDTIVNATLTGIGNTSDPNVIGASTTNLQTESTYVDSVWDFVGETFNGIDDIWFIPQQDYPHLWWEGMKVPMKLTPVSLNCRSEGNWVKAHITLPEGFIVADMNSDRPAVLHSYGFQSSPLYVFVNKDKVVEIEAAFERQAVCSLVGNWPEELTVAGFLSDGNIFLGTSTVRINHPGMKVIEELANCWLQEDCIYPETDMNRDSLVNLLDYAFLMNTNVEFVTDE